MQIKVPHIKMYVNKYTCNLYIKVKQQKGIYNVNISVEKERCIKSMTLISTLRNQEIKSKQSAEKVKEEKGWNTYGAEVSILEYRGKQRKELKPNVSFFLVLEKNFKN